MVTPPPSLPPRASLEHLKKQAKQLLRQYRAGAPEALDRFARFLPAAAGRSSTTIAAMDLRLHDAQSCLARGLGFVSWAALALRVEAEAFAREAPLARRDRWLTLAYGGDVAGGAGRARPALALRLLRAHPALADDLAVACATGDAARLAAALAADPGWLHRPAGPLALPPLVAVTHSGLLQLEDFRAPLQRCAGWLLQAGADPNQRIGNRYPPASLAAPDDAMPLSALYGAAGVNRDPALTALLLQAGADPNDNESLYHSLESPDCARLLLRHGARVRGTNAVHRALDLPGAGALELLLAHGGDPEEVLPGSRLGPPLLRAIALGRSPRHVAALLAAGADPAARDAEGASAWRLAARRGLVEVAALLQAAGAAEELSTEEEFGAACARGDAATARRLQAARPDLPGGLPATLLRLLPDSVAAGATGAARLMVALGWPVATPGGDWQASALNLAVFRGDAALAGILLDHGARWDEAHGFGSDVLGTLSWASLNEPDDAAAPDWPGCARALAAAGLPPMAPDPADPERLLLDGRALRFSEAVAAALLGD
ncbi:hypothetical protein BKE38_06960 [Pseudoroseomonas deserti]|uniref:Uncharacterized protein n=1 Tax=Teichococcus deserti TaxID=1817963 RepID=A0A1V2H4U2_9PROT|nr:hypothetical protein [Pseudoroseomonas deserti]ONG56064.1 hypothetical protein BKE38_06960 [Pseudoroseomonas deserti]